MKKTYRMCDYVLIPFKLEKRYSLFMLSNRILGALMMFAQVMCMSKIIDNGLLVIENSKEMGGVLIPLFGLVAIIIYNNFSWLLTNKFDLELRKSMEKDLKDSINMKIAKLQYKYIEDNDSWELISRTCEDPVRRFVEGFFNILDIMSLCIQITSLCWIVVIHVWWIALVILLLALGLVMLALKSGKDIYRESMEVEKHRKIERYLHGVLSDREHAEERKLFNFSEIINDRWYKEFEYARKRVFFVRLKWNIKVKMNSIISTIFCVAVIAALLYPVKTGLLSLGIFVGIVNAVFELVKVMSWQLPDVIQKYSSNKAYLRDYTEFMALSEVEGAIDECNAMNLFIVNSIEFKNVSFQYPGTDIWILKDFSVKIEKGKHYALVGENGAGKTTIVKLLTGLYSDYQGFIYINDKDIREYNQSELRSIFSVVFQDFSRFSLSLKDNIILGNTDVNEKQQLEKVLNDSGLEKFVKDLPEGINTDLGKATDESIDLSGGQWQKIAIARALFRNGQVNILDEPTAALDPSIESDIYNMFDELFKDKITIVITHRLGAAKLADAIVVLSDGKVCELGSHEELINKNGVYVNMYNAQKSWYL